MSPLTPPGSPSLLPAPAYDAGGLVAVLPSAAAALGVPLPPQLPTFELGSCGRALVVLVDGMGAQLLAARRGHTPFLGSLAGYPRTAHCGFPTTTATSMGSFGTGRPPGQHGLVGYEVRDPGTGVVFNELSWQDGPPPRRWQPGPTVLELAAADGVAVHRIGPAHFDGSGLTEAALRGGGFTAARELAEGVDRAADLVRRERRALVYLYWGDLDRVGHVHGVESWQWVEELESIDAELERLAGLLPAGTALVVTADHGMLDVPMSSRLDLAHDAELASGVEQVGGEPRAPQLYCRAGAAPDVAATWRARLGEHAYVHLRREVVAAGWFGPQIAGTVMDRIGDVVVSMRDAFAVVDSRVHRPALLSLLGLHGALTPVEVEVPVLVHRF